MISHLRVRQLSEEKEEGLSLLAVKSRLSRGRLKYEEPCAVRTAFQRDRDRIIHCKAFRRLKHKTQVFIAPLSDHYVTRLTHTLEVSQIARTISRALNLNEDLTEAIALGHDLGHTPFGHIGEEVLNELYPPGFRHNEQGLRVVDLLENDGRGLNLTWEVRDGIVNHSKSRADVMEEGGGKPGTLEGEVCKIADAIAYINHDIGDAIRADILTEDSLPASTTDVLGHSHSKRINTMVCDIIEQSWGVRDGHNTTSPLITMSPGVMAATNTLRGFLFERVYNLHSAQREAKRAREVVRLLYNYFKENKEKLLSEYSLHGEEVELRVVDYIAGMTDQYALRLVEELSLAGGPGLAKSAAYRRSL
ncbi:MAG: deoxyguanosinetriphosphate triphosphohydrolase [Dehalococcoidales bacterium]|nr:deoxyguanosinetriphosphate triphosphohydrolase [Dehalococcoidales bacterium]